VVGTRTEVIAGRAEENFVTTLIRPHRLDRSACPLEHPSPESRKKERRRTMTTQIETGEREIVLVEDARIRSIMGVTL
jgi:hypothetical protein